MFPGEIIRPAAGVPDTKMDYSSLNECEWVGQPQPDRSQEEAT